MKYKSFFLLTSFLLTLSCNMGGVKTVKDPNKRFSVDAPFDMIRADDLNDDASLQLKNELTELYLIVIEYDKDEVNEIMGEEEIGYSPDILGYAEMIFDEWDDYIEVMKSSGIEKTTINGMPALERKMSAKVYDLNFVIYYHQVFVEGKNDYYQILAWTLDDQKEKFLESIEKMVNSFKELD